MMGMLASFLETEGKIIHGVIESYKGGQLKDSYIHM